MPSPWPLLLCLLPTQASDPDTDGDGLSDFHERHKHFTDPAREDSDGDGVPDGDRNERREFTYTVRSILQVLPPVTGDVLCDDYQDARVLLDTAELVELEVVHYPLNTVASTLAADPHWRATVRARADLAPYLTSSTTSDFDAEMAREFAAELTEIGLDLATVDDRTLVERATRWILDHTAYQDSFTTFCSTFEGGSVRVLPGLEGTAEQGVAEDGLSLEDSWQRELFARGMWKNKVHGSCTSSAIFWTGCLRALGIPTRIVLCTPVIDATDEREWKLAERALTRESVRSAVLEALGNSRGGWTSHTFNEVFVGGRWRRLNYAKLAQNTLDANYLGLMTHIATLRDWADGEFAQTWGKRQAGDHDDVLGFGNPYSAVSLSDRLGPHATLAPDPVRAPVAPEGTVTIDALYWGDDPELPDWVREPDRHPPFLAVHVVEWTSWPELKRFTAASDRRFTLEAAGHPALGVELAVGGWTTSDGEVRLLHLPLGGADWNELVPLVDYRLVPRNKDSKARWAVADALVVRRDAK